jgi:hypothetical protein
MVDILWAHRSNSETLNKTIFFTSGRAAAAYRHTIALFITEHKHCRVTGSVKVALNQWFIRPSFVHFSTATLLYIDWIVRENVMKRVALQFMNVPTTFVRSVNPLRTPSGRSVLQGRHQ